MNKRQIELLSFFFYNANQFFSVQELSDRIHCSEKTLRNDCKQIDSWLQEHSSALLIRKPGKGIYLQSDDTISKNGLRLLHQNTKNTFPEQSDEKRKYKILYSLLQNPNTSSIHTLASSFYVNKAVIRKNLEEIEEWLQPFGLLLTKKQKLGIHIEGTEKQFRTALAKVMKILLQESIENTSSIFPKEDAAYIRYCLEKVSKQFPLTFTDEAMENLLVHILIGIKRMKTKCPIVMPHAELEQIQTYPEHEVTLSLVPLLEKRFVLHISEEEASYITLHIAGSKMLPQTERSEETESIVVDFIHSFISRMESLTEISFTNDPQLYENLSIHMHTSFNRLKHGLYIDNPMEEEIKKMYPYMYELVLSSLTKENDLLPYHIPKEEVAYVTIHFQSSLERLEKTNGNNKKALIVCTLGVGMSQLLRTKIERKFHSLEIVDCISKHELQTSCKEHTVDFVISNVSLEHCPVPYIQLSPLFSEQEEKRLQQFLTTDENMQVHFPAIKKWLQADMIFMNIQERDRFSVLKHIVKEMIKQKYVHKDYLASVLERESLSSTAIGNELAIPHGDPKWIHKPVIAFAKLPEPILWGTEKVSLIFLLSYNIHEIDNTKQLFSELSSLSENLQIITFLKEKQTKEEIFEIL